MYGYPPVSVNQKLWIMKENVGTKDRLIRATVGPALIGIGYLVLGGKKGKLSGISAIVGGSLLIESALTRVCPVNGILGIDTREKKSPLKRIKEAIA